MGCVTSSQGLRQRIRDSYEARWKAEKHFDEEEIMQELPNSLRTEARLPGLSTAVTEASRTIEGVSQSPF